MASPPAKIRAIREIRGKNRGLKPEQLTGEILGAAMAVLNELVWRSVSTDAWVTFKAFGFLPLTFLFALAQMPLMQRHSEPADSGPELPDEPTSP